MLYFFTVVRLNPSVFPIKRHNLAPLGSWRVQAHIRESTALARFRAFTESCSKREFLMVAGATVHKGLDGIIVDESRLSLVNGAEGKLIYSGYKIEDLAANALYEEVVYLLWEGRLPKKDELEALRADIARNAVLPEPVLEMLKSLPKDANPMAVLRTAASALSLYDPDGEDNSPEANRR